MSDPGDNPSNRPGPSSKIDRLIQSMDVHRELLRRERDKTVSKPKNKYVIYKTPLIKIMSLPNWPSRYKATAMGEPDIIPEDIELFVNMELERISRESKE